jgi:hypothetical protein
LGIAAKGRFFSGIIRCLVQYVSLDRARRDGGSARKEITLKPAYRAVFFGKGVYSKKGNIYMELVLNVF